jgi:DNA gyrase/topoisomerase IV subunit B
MTKNYTHKDIIKLSDIEHVQESAGMYIGNITNPVHLIEEALDNALDEALSGYAKIIAVTINTKTNICCVMDNGRGVPIENDTPILISNTLHTGAKFNSSKTAYKIVAGKNGIGLITILALSEFYIIEIYRNNKHAKYTFENTKLKHKIIEDFKETPPFSTKIQFKASKKFFESVVPDIDRIRKRLLVASVEIPDTTLVLTVDDKKEVIKLSKDEFFSNYCLNDSDTTISPVIDINVRNDFEKFEAKFCYSLEGSITPRVISSINLLPVDDGGTHVNCFYDLLKEFFITKAKKANLKFQPNDCLSGLRVYFSLELEKPDYSSQSKDKLINRKDHFINLINKVKNELEKYFTENPTSLNDLLTFFDEYRKKLDSKKIKGTINGKRASTKFTKLRDCSGSHGDLYVVEGDSAGGGFIECRSAKIHAVLPLKGKIPSIVNKEDILGNKEISELIGSLGTGIGPSFDITKLKYNRVICTADPDADGGHIFCLMTIALAMLVPEIIKQGHFYLSLIPLYVIEKGKTFIPIWTAEELSKAREKNEPITRLKGLGELDPWKLKICCLDEKTRKLQKVVWTSDLQKIINLFSDVNVKRELLKTEL